MARGTFVEGVNPSVALVARGEPPAATTAQNQALEQCPTFASDVGQQQLDFVALVLGQNLLVIQILLPTNIARMMILN
jgi:hypothetical protein